MIVLHVIISGHNSTKKTSKCQFSILTSKILEGFLVLNNLITN